MRGMWSDSWKIHENFIRILSINSMENVYGIHILTCVDVVYRLVYSTLCTFGVMHLILLSINLKVYDAVDFPLS